ncbi:hypothetical protein EBU71_21170, partial [bacterium]|nr:hypothetical protein [Candidatus Elulimicrobium humile]
VKLDIYDIQAYGAIQYYFNQLNPDNTPSQLPPGMKLDIKNGEIFGLLPYQASIMQTYHFTITATRFGKGIEKAPVSRTFTIRVLGEVNSSMSWITQPILGSIDSNYVSTLKIEATSTLTNPVITYSVVRGQLPPGLTLLSNGEIVGKIKQYTQNNSDNLTTFYDEIGTPGQPNYQRFINVSLDGNETRIDRNYKFVVRASDQTNYSSIDQEFILDIITPNDRPFSNLYVTTYMKIDKRRTFDRFITNSNVFPESHIYRFSDPNFGIRKDLRVLVYGGIETKNVEEYISIIGLNHKRKRLRFGDLKTAKAKNPFTNDTVYEVVYLEMIDSQDLQDRHLPLKITYLNPSSTLHSVDMSNIIWRNQGQDFYTLGKEPFMPRPLEYISIDRTNINVSDYHLKNRYPNTITNWRT